MGSEYDSVYGAYRYIKTEILYILHNALQRKKLGQ